ncbi:unnamed protein product [Candida verbasci]|uniref:Uncharacterized protein n=1 Tax=Candida verbasci TaxID=1227364 RepID=A0A9W4TZ83_9ASCO|nr:unnamed protein product [Candida verbasci]
MKAFTRLLKHVQSIKFVGGPHPTPKPHAAQAHPFAPNGLMPGQGSSSSSNSTPYHNPNSIKPKDGECFSRSELPERFRYKAIKDQEIDDIISGGAEVIY